MRDERLRRLIICALLIATECHSASFRWPYVTYMDVKSSTSWPYTDYILHMGTTTVNDDSITDQTTVEEVMKRHGLSADTGERWWWGTYMRTKLKPNGWDLAYIRVQHRMNGKDKWVEAANNVAASVGSGTISMTPGGIDGANECVGTGAWGVYPSYPSWEYWLQNYVWNGGLTGECIGTPPAGQWCALKTPVVEIAYGTLTLKDADGSNKTAGVTVECTTGMKYTLRLQDANNETTLDNGGRVTWQAGGKALGETLTGVAGDNDIKLDATLHGPFERTGTFQGSGILFVSYP